jgi:hypothetical protein
MNLVGSDPDDGTFPNMSVQHQISGIIRGYYPTIDPMHSIDFVIEGASPPSTANELV